MPEVFNPIITHLYANQDGTPKEVTRYNDAIISEINVDNTKYDFGRLYNENMFSGNRVWNQLVQNGNFNGTTGWNGNTATISASNNMLTAVQTDVANYFGIVTAIASIPTNHKILVSFEAKADEATNIRIRYPASLSPQSLTTSFKRFGFFANSGSTGFPNDGQLYLQVYNTSSINTAYFKNVQLFDLTDIYGAGNEPSTYEEFYHDYKDDYYPYNAGTVFSTATKLLNTIKQPFESATFYGSTKKWNQLVQNGDFSDINDWSTAGASFSVSNNIATVTNANGYSYARINTLVKRVIDHKYFAIITARTATNGGGGNNYFFVNQYLDGNSGPTVALFSQSIGSSWTTLSMVYTATTSSETSLVNIYPNNQNSAQIGDSTEVKNFMVVDLTAIYGAGNEPTASEFLSSLKRDYYPYSNGEIASVYRAFTDVRGLNLWDEEWEVGGYDHGTGAKNNVTTVIRCKNPIPVLPNKLYYITEYSYVHFYDASGAYLSYVAEAQTFTTPSNCCFICFNATTSYGTTYNHDICISISDPSVNGVYEAYKATQLIRCYGINLWDEEWEVGTISDTTGENVVASNRIRSKGYIPISPNTTLYAKTGGDYYLYPYYYTDDKKFISALGGVKNGTFTPPANAKYMRFIMQNIYGTTYNNDICINISESGIDGTYYPYREYSKLSGVGDFNDTLVVNSDGTGSYTKSVGTYTFDGTETWYQGSSQTTAGMYRYYLWEDTGMKKGLAQDGLCNAFENLGANWNQSTQEGVFFGINNEYFQFITATEKTTEELQAIFNSSVTIVYPLETEVSTQLTQQELEYVLNGAFTYSPYSTLSIGNENEVSQTNDVEIWEQR